MDQIFNRLYNLFRSVFDDDPFDNSSFEQTKRRYYDPDLADAWEELDDYLKGGGEGSQDRTSGQRHYSQKSVNELEALRKDYSNLEVPFGASFEEVRKSYRSLLRKYHPDKYANDPNKLKITTEITKKINQSYQNIKVFEEKNAGKGRV